MKKFKKLSQIELQNTTGGIYRGVTVPIVIPNAVSKWISNYFFKKK